MHYFASDIHLGAKPTEKSRLVEQRFVEWLDEIEPTAETLFLLGDVFDFWFEYGEVVPKGFVRVLGRLADMTRKGIKVIFFTGNHDMWVGDYLQKECGITVYKSPQQFTIASRNMLLAHGDNINIKGQPMLRLMNAIFRSRTLKFLLSWLIHPNLTLKFGKWWSGSSRKSHGEENSLRFLDPLKEFAAQYASKNKVDCFIFGHMHIVSQSDEPRCYFLGDWQQGANWLEMDAEGNITQQTE